MFELTNSIVPLFCQKGSLCLWTSCNTLAVTGENKPMQAAIGNQMFTRKNEQNSCIRLREKKKTFFFSKTWTIGRRAVSKRNVRRCMFSLSSRVFKQMIFLSVRKNSTQRCTGCNMHGMRSFPWESLTSQLANSLLDRIRKLGNLWQNAQLPGGNIMCKRAENEAASSNSISSIKLYKVENWAIQEREISMYHNTSESLWVNTRKNLLRTTVWHS